MTIIVTPGGSDSNSYATLAEANAYHETRLHNAAWTDASDATKEAALLWATRELDSNMCWNGIRATEEQALDWPQYGQSDKDGYYIDSDIVPDQVKNAQSELAFLLIEEDRTVADDPCCGAQEAKAGTLSIKFDKTDRKGTISDSTLALIQEFGHACGAGLPSGGSSVVWTQRV